MVSTSQNFVSALLCVAFLPASAAALPAFPGAEGFGSETPGGRGGRVYIVENRNDSGPGSLREALEASGPRIVVFAVGGTITLRSPIEIDEPFVTVAGQSAPGGGIQIRNDPDGWGGLRTGRGPDSFVSLEIATHDVVLRYLRIRPGPLTPNAACTRVGAIPAPPRMPGTTCVEAGDIRAIRIHPGSHDIVLDHLSLSFSSDEIVNIKGARDVTIQWSVLSEAMNFLLYEGFASAKVAGWNSKGALIGGKSSARMGEITGRISIHHNLWAHNHARSPALSTHCFVAEFPERCVADVVNNVIYNWGYFASDMNNLVGHHFGNAVGNYFKMGPDGPEQVGDLRALTLHDWSAHRKLAHLPGARLSVFFDDNLLDRGEGELEAVPVDVYRWDPVASRWKPGRLADYASVTRFPAPPVFTTSAVAAYADVLAGVGAVRSLDGAGAWKENRDGRDAALVSDVRTGTGHIIQDLSAFPGWPQLAPGNAALDGDRDGMPDEWEVAQCLDAEKANAADDPDGDGYSNVEEYLNGTPVTGQCGSTEAPDA